ncbi:A/G-specific adenine glycosylase [Selenomonas sp. TAMA-11512]|uniref:A/G-specific adenine glycosylase n=1 Tax=Selenomonas sp. TAMA-11512 TaxID=3095337 RepID=UPI003089B49E|nr:A/G-specific adenine glycosylase [Selenomonas sp. TAMA-11512]
MLELNVHIRDALLTWYRASMRTLPWRDAPTPYHVWISEIMLQQTRVEAVRSYYTRFIDAIPDIPSLAALEEETLLKYWQGLGYYSRARNLKRAAQEVMEKYNGELPRDFDALLSLPGIGRYTAGAILSIAYHLPYPAVDGNVLRVVMRLAGFSLDILQDTTKRRVEEALLPILPDQGKSCSDMTQAFMDLGSSICLPKKPLCLCCPLSSFCRAYADDLTDALPYRSPKKKRRIEKLTVLRLSCQNQLAIRQRSSEGLLANLWELPHLNDYYKKQSLLDLFDDRGYDVTHIEKLPVKKHIFSHIEWHMQGWDIKLASTSPKATGVKEAPAAYMSSDEAFPDQLVWASEEDIANRYSIPTAFSYYL